MKMHDGELDIDAENVARLVAEQFPDLAGLPIRAVHSTGTVNALFRLGDDLYARLPRVQKWASDLSSELRWLPELAAHLSLRVPEPVARGRPASWYPFSWAIYRWIEGAPYADELVDDERATARCLAQFVAEMRSFGIMDGAPAGGRKPLRQLDAETREAFAEAGNLINAPAALAAWEHALQAPAWSGRAVWVHADLLPPNLLVSAGKLTAVIDFGGAGVGDPAADVIAAWSVFRAEGRAEFRSALAVDDDTWHRARGYALHQAALIIPYYRLTNPDLAAQARRTVGEVISDLCS